MDATTLAAIVVRGMIQGMATEMFCPGEALAAIWVVADMRLD